MSARHLPVPFTQVELTDRQWAPRQRVVMPVPLPGAKINPADSVRALTPDRPTAIPGAKVNPADSARAEAIRKQQSDTTRKPE